MAAPKYSVWDRRLKSGEPLYACTTRDALYAWILRGLRNTQGAERDHYISCLLQVADGETELYYDLDA